MSMVAPVEWKVHFSLPTVGTYEQHATIPVLLSEKRVGHPAQHNTEHESGNCNRTLLLSSRAFWTRTDSGWEAGSDKHISLKGILLYSHVYFKNLIDVLSFTLSCVCCTDVTFGVSQADKTLRCLFFIGGFPAFFLKTILK